MGLIRAIIISVIIYFAWKVIEDGFLSKATPELKCKISPWVPLGLVFIIELLI